jgi:3-methyladenine DNA glycosylase AlkD
MNGVISDSMQKKGMNYRLNYGVDIPKLRIIARKYEADKTLAEMLWVEDVREFKILATMLYPPGDFTKETAEKWVREIPTQEIREQVCRNLFQELSFADALVQEWAENDDTDIRLTGYWLFARLCMARADVANKVSSKKIIENAVNDLKAKSMLLRQAALNVLKYFGRLSNENSVCVLQKVSSFEQSSNSVEREMFDILRFEFEFVET